MNFFTRQEQQQSEPWWQNPSSSTISCWYLVQETRFSKELEFLNSPSTWCWWVLSSFVNLVIAFWMKVVGLNWDFFSESLPKNGVLYGNAGAFCIFLLVVCLQGTLKSCRCPEAYICRSKSPVLSPCGSIPVQYIMALVGWFVTALFHPTGVTVSCRKN